jgi:hypothetical protein
MPKVVNTRAIANLKIQRDEALRVILEKFEARATAPINPFRSGAKSTDFRARVPRKYDEAIAERLGMNYNQVTQIVGRFERHACD